ncbi:hypothetical protein TNCV_996421 [Trichonephila clavipes]|nr:hypothetical protein TNCV_996421 [Trichonephila clavipes]
MIALNENVVFMDQDHKPPFIKKRDLSPFFMIFSFADKKEHAEIEFPSLSKGKMLSSILATCIDDIPFRSSSPVFSLS